VHDLPCLDRLVQSFLGLVLVLVGIPGAVAVVALRRSLKQ
jgi:hypothetical protein